MKWLDGSLITDSMDEFEQAPGDGGGQGGLAQRFPWGRKESDTTEQQQQRRFENIVTPCTHSFLCGPPLFLFNILLICRQTVIYFLSKWICL